jgi:galactose oxidase
MERSRNHLDDVVVAFAFAVAKGKARSRENLCFFLYTGGGLCGGCSSNHLDFEILSPPYLYNADGITLATRPSIQSLSALSARAGGTFSVTMDTVDTHSFAMIKASAVTHGVNNDQRRLPLAVVGQAGGTFSLEISANVNVALPGFYFLFAMNANGVPSIGEAFHIDL